VFDYPTVEDLAGHLATILPELIEATDRESVDSYQGLTRSELLQQLSARSDRAR
jgi:phthiocerol/phenolphthiocerol synthesis type-I polyketide synthase B